MLKLNFIILLKMKMKMLFYKNEFEVYQIIKKLNHPFYSNANL